MFFSAKHSFLIPPNPTTVVVTASEAKINKTPIFRGKYAYNNDIGSEKKQRPRRGDLLSRRVLFCLSVVRYNTVSTVVRLETVVVRRYRNLRGTIINPKITCRREKTVRKIGRYFPFGFQRFADHYLLHGQPSASFVDFSVCTHRRQTRTTGMDESRIFSGNRPSVKIPFDNSPV